MASYFTIPGVAPDQLQLSCPPAATGQTTNPNGSFDLATVSAAVHASAAALGLALLLLVFWCYSWSRGSLGPKFVRRWWTFTLSSLVVGAAVVWVVLSYWPTTALPNECQSDPTAFRAPLPSDFVMGQTLSAAFFGLLFFMILSVLFTQTIGRIPRLKNGFFHNRGCPVPRFLP
jgi:hypothetical protein